MESPQIVARPAFTIIGIKYRGKNEHNDIYEMWQRFIPREEEIQNRLHVAVCYGAMDNYDEATGEFDYVAAFEVTGYAPVPEGMVRWEIPAARYAVFACTLSTLGKTFDHAYKTWLPRSGHDRASGPEFELYDEHYVPEDPDSKMYIYIPIQ